MSDDYVYCHGCHEMFADEHTDCPAPCSLCGLAITGRRDSGCPGHNLREYVAFLAALRAGESR
jgi:hypothetical protein